MTLAGRHTGTSAAAHPLAHYRAEFPIFRDGIYLNTCSLGALGDGRRPRVVVTSLDFPTVAYQWLAKRARGVELVVVESPDRVSVPVEAIARAVDERTALVATSHVYFTSGAIQDIAAVAAAAHQRGALALVEDRKSTRLNSSHVAISYAVFC